MPFQQLFNSEIIKHLFLLYLFLSSIDIGYKRSRGSSETEDEELNVLKVIVSQWYDSHVCLSMLKVLFSDMMDFLKLSDTTNTMELLNTLYAQGQLNLGLICDTIAVTKQFGLQREIKKRLPSFPEVQEGSISKAFTSHRQKLMKFGMQLTINNVRQLDALYNVPAKRYTDSWSMISDLENREIISERYMEPFIDSLKFSLNLTEACEVLTEDIGYKHSRGSSETKGFNRQFE
ncbi:uncharacterized protein LOC117108139 [Anneissia japonica]|uniref:uncharacterized protein LOC117108139 n=1 Tax=Anneissia japonica TaxID=1529436 RepID=UPI0014254CE4|nr:uncharacterized protein LOC117108139 [Anneissia japonica]